MAKKTNQQVNKKTTAKKKSAPKQENVSRKTNLKNFKQTNGRLPHDDSDFKNNVRTLDEIMGIRPRNPFGTDNAQEFEKLLKEEMNLADMQELAVKVGLMPVYDRGRLTKSLLREFKVHMSKLMPYSKVDRKPDTSLKTSDKKISDRARQTMGEGR